MDKGAFIVFEGIDGSGKSTQIRYLMERLRGAGARCYETREPTDGPVGSLIRQFLTGRIPADEKVIASLFVADRLDHLLNAANGIAGKINGGVSVVCDRYYLSSYAYHGAAMPMGWVIEANSISADILRPACHVFIDIDPGVALERVKRERFHTELFETYDRLAAVREKYFEAFELVKGDENIVVVDGTLDEASLAEVVWGEVSGFFGG